MAVTAKTFGKIALLALGAAGLGYPLYGMAQEHDHSAHDHSAHAGHAMAEALPPLTEEEVTASRALFSQYGCAACHQFADAGGSGHIGPALDGNAGLSVDYVTQIVSDGQGAMPGFGGMMSEAQLATLARYIVEKKQ
jgi:cytochrome c551/c552